MTVRLLPSPCSSVLTPVTVAPEPTIMKKIAVQGIFSRFLRN